MAKGPKERSRIVPPESGGAPAIVLPCPPDEFRDFIAGLLGKPQTIERYFVGPVEVTRPDAENLYHLLDQRIASQNDATLIQFTAQIVYDDNSSVLLNSFSDFHSYNEVKPLISTGLHLSWTYLIQFKNKRYPEKQTVDVSFRAGSSEFENEPRISNEGIWVRLGSPRNLPGFIRIQHTDRTWGVDIEALLKGQIDTLTKTVPRARRIANKYAGVVGFGASVIAFLISLILSYRVAEHFSFEYMAQARAIKPTDADALARKIDFLVGLVASGAWTRFGLVLTFFMIAVVLGAIICGLVVASAASISSPSFVLLTTRAAEAKHANERKIRNNWYSLAASIAATLLLGVIANLIFYLCLLWWGP
jgi:hypothetical protein